MFYVKVKRSKKICAIKKQPKGCFLLITSNALDHWRQPVESGFQADNKSDWQA